MGFVAVAVLGMLALSAGAMDERCQGVRFVDGEVPAATASLACEGVDRARRFFRRLGLDAGAPVTIAFLESASPVCTQPVGTFSADAAMIEMLPLGLARDRVDVFRAPMDGRLYTSFVAHEATHAIAHPQFLDGAATPLAHEYLAYAAQLSTLPAIEREAILTRYRLQGFESLGAVSLTYYGLDPCAFGVKVFLHFAAQPDPAGLVRRVLDGATPLSDPHPD
jgi:hypothetical protein